MKVYLVANKDNTIFVSKWRPCRWGMTDVKNGWGVKQRYIDRQNKVIEIPWKVMADFPDDAMVTVPGNEGLNDLWDHTDEELLGTFEITKDDCDLWEFEGHYMEISELTCKKLWGIVPTWDDEPIEVEF